MPKLNLGVEIRDFDLERIGFSLSVLSVLDETQRQSIEGYLRMTLTELDTFLAALKSSPEELELTTIEAQGAGAGRLPNVNAGPELPIRMSPVAAPDAISSRLLPGAKPTR